MPLRQVVLSTTPTLEEVAALRLGDIVYLNGWIYTAREGVYRHVLEEGAKLPIALPEASAANFHCSPAATIRHDGSIELGAVTATASFRFAKYLPRWMALTGTRLVIGKGGMSSKDYKEYFVPSGAVYLSTVGYGTGALLGRGVTGVQSVFWHQELGIAQAMWVIRCSRIGPFIAASDLAGNCLFERENSKTAETIAAAYAGTSPATLKRYGETDDRGDELIG